MVKATSDSSITQVKKNGFFYKIFVAVTFGIAFLTVISGWVGLFNPASFWFFSLTGLGFPILFVINLIILILWFLSKRMIAWIPLAAFLVTVVKFPSLIQFDGSSEKPDFVEGQSAEIKLMSFNVRLFDLYNWTHNEATRNSIMNLLSEEQPAILCLQEFYSSERHDFDNVKALKEVLKASNYHLEYPITLHGKDNWGIATISAYPIVYKGVLYFDQKTANICIYTDIKVESDTIRVYNCHLQSVRFGAEEYKFLENLGQNEEEQTVKRTKSILTRLKTAFIKRAAQSNLIAEHIRECPYPVIVCGDFNDTPLSYTYKQISEGLLDAFRESGFGLGSTYAGPIPGLRIDYLFHSPAFTSFHYKTIRSKLSDHYPIKASIVLNPKK